MHSVINLNFRDSAKRVENISKYGIYTAMTKLEKIEQDIASLDPKDVRRLADWIDEYKAELWDRQLEEDAKAGRLDKFAAAALANHKQGKTKPL